MAKFHRGVLVLDSRYDATRIVSLEQGFVLLFTGRAIPVVNSERQLRSINSVFTVPWIIQLQGAAPAHKRNITPRFSRKNVYLRDKFQCQYCGFTGHTSFLTLDHMIPASQGGLTTWENVLTACRSCNHRKGSRRLEELGLRPIRYPIRPVFPPHVVFALRYGLSPKNIPSAWEPYLNLSLLEDLEPVAVLKNSA